MAYTPHTKEDIQTMLAAIGVKNIEALFDEIPPQLRIQGFNKATFPKQLTEMEAMREMAQRARQDHVALNFIGAGAYEHHVPAAVWDIASRGEFLTAYTPYQAEVSQGTLQVIYEFQTMLASLMGMQVANASMYDGASALAEAVLMAIRTEKKAPKNKSAIRRILIPTSLHPSYRQVVKTITKHQNIEIVEVPYCTGQGSTILDSLKNYANEPASALVIPQPNFFGILEDVDALTDWAHTHNMLAIAVVNPMAMALLKEPGSWGSTGVDIVCGEGQPLGVPLASGGPYFGFLCCKKQFVRHIPGRLVGRTVDTTGKPGFVLTLQAREQHIRRSKATSNICTNQGLLVTAATVYMSLMGAEGLHQIAAVCHHNARELCAQLTAVPGVERVFSGSYFHEFVLKLNKPTNQVLARLAERGIQAGFALQNDYPGLADCLLVCATETKTTQDLVTYKQALEEIL